MPSFVPNRRDIIMLDFDPTKGKEIGKYRPALVLSSRTYNKATGFIICCPISTSIRGGDTEVPVNNIDKPSVVAASMVQTLSWRSRGAKKIAVAEDGVLENTLMNLLPLMGAEEIFNE